MSALQSPIDLTVVDGLVKPSAGVAVVAADMAGAVQVLASTMHGTPGLNDSDCLNLKCAKSRSRILEVLSLLVKESWTAM